MAAFLVGILGGPLGLLIYAGAPDLKARFLMAQASDLIANRIAALASPTGRRHLKRVHKRMNLRAYETQPPSGEGEGETSGEGAARAWERESMTKLADLRKLVEERLPKGDPPEGGAQ